MPLLSSRENKEELDTKKGSSTAAFFCAFYNDQLVVQHVF